MNYGLFASRDTCLFSSCQATCCPSAATQTEAMTTLASTLRSRAGTTGEEAQEALATAETQALQASQASCICREVFGTAD